jgi:hypothetical protein
MPPLIRGPSGNGLQSERKLVARLVIFRGLIYPQSPWRECTFNVIQLGFCLLISFIGLVNPSKSSWPWQPWPAVPPKMWPQQEMPWNSPCFFSWKAAESEIPRRIPSWTLPETALRLRRKNGLNAAEGALQAAKKMASWPAGCLPAGRDWGSNFSYLNKTESYLWYLMITKKWMRWDEMLILFWARWMKGTLLIRKVKTCWKQVTLHMFTEMV